MNKKSLFLVTILCLASAFAFAQSVDSGAKAYENGDYKGALSTLDKALENPKLKDKALAKGHYYRAMAKSVYVRKNKEDLSEAVIKTAEDHAVTASADLAKARMHDKDEKLTAEIKEAQKQLNEYLLDLAGHCGLAAKKDGSKTEAEKKDLYERMIVLCAPVLKHDKFNYRSYEFTADAQLALGDSAKALENYKKADSWFFRSAPKNGDQAIAFTYIHIAQLEWKLNGNFDGAIEALEEGRKVLGGESKKIQSFGSGTAASKGFYSEQHKLYMTDIQQAEVEIRAEAGKPK